MNTTLTKLFLYQQNNLRGVKAGRSPLPLSTPLAVSHPDSGVQQVGDMAPGQQS